MQQAPTLLLPWESYSDMLSNVLFTRRVVYVIFVIFVLYRYVKRKSIAVQYFFVWRPTIDGRLVGCRGTHTVIVCRQCRPSKNAADTDGCQCRGLIRQEAAYIHCTATRLSRLWKYHSVSISETFEARQAL